MIDDEDEDDEEEDEEDEEVDPDAPPSPSASPPPSPTLGTLKSRPTTLNLTTAVSQVSILRLWSQTHCINKLFDVCFEVVACNLSLTIVFVSLSSLGFTEQQ